jgi:hypothetical protein
MWKANGKTTTLQLFLDSLSAKTEKLSLEETMDLSRDRIILELEATQLAGAQVCPHRLKDGNLTQKIITALPPLSRGSN